MPIKIGVRMFFYKKTTIKRKDLKKKCYIYYIQMSGSDSYILAKSLEPQGLTEHSPFESENWNYIPDLNSGIYASSGLSLVQFDLN